MTDEMIVISFSY